MNHVDADDAANRSDRPTWLRGVQDNRRAHIRDLCGLHPCGDPQQGFRFRIGRLESETREISRKMNDASPEPLAISRMTPVVGGTSRRTSRMKSRLRTVGGAYRRWQKRDLSARHYVYVWADGVYLQTRMKGALSQDTGVSGI